MTDQQINRFGFWRKLNKPIVGLSPMDGVTDAPMRFIAKKYGKADIVYTEFVSAEGLWRIEKRGDMEAKIWQDLRFSEIERPVIAQIFGSDPESFYESAKIICRLGFDGIDINMGCPSPGLEKRGGGAGLIRDKCNAVEVVEATRQGVRSQITAMPAGRQDVSCQIPVSVKTRIGSDKPDEEWWKVLAGMNLPAVAMHGRTFKQLYSGEADWDSLVKAGEVIRESGALFLGNGDIKKINVGMDSGSKPGMTMSVITNHERKIDLTGKMDGVLVGRGAIGNPWVLRTRSQITDVRSQIDIEEKLRVAVEHARKFEEMLPEQKFFVMRKHLVGYASGFPEAVELRKKLVMTNSADEVGRVIHEWLGKK